MSNLELLAAIVGLFLISMFAYGCKLSEVEHDDPPMMRLIFLVLSLPFALFFSCVVFAISFTPIAIAIGVVAGLVLWLT